METNKRRKDLKIKIRKVSTEAGKQYEIQGNITDFSIKIGDDTKQARYDVSREVEKQEVIMIGKLHAHEKHSVSDSSTQRARVEHATTSRQRRVWRTDFPKAFRNCTGQRAMWKRKAGPSSCRDRH